MTHKSIKIFTILISFIVGTNFIFAEESKFDSLVTIGINNIYNIKFDKAKVNFAQLEKLYPQHPAGKFFNAMIIWWQIMLDQDNESYDELFEDKLEEVIDFCDDILDENDKDIDALFFKGGSLGFRGRLYSIRKEWFDAALDGKDALPIVYEAYEIDPTNEDVKLGFGIYNYYAAAIPEKYPFIKPAMIFFPSGDKEKGIKQLEAAAEKAKYAAIEAEFFLMNLYYQFEDDYNKALIYAEALHNKFPDNPIFHKYLGRIYIKKGNYHTASKYFLEIKNKYEDSVLGYSDVLMREASYYLGVNYMNKNEIESAKSSFTLSTNLSEKLDARNDEESGFQINGYLYLGKICANTNDNELAKKYYNKVLDMRDYRNSHDKVKRYLVKLEENKKAGN